MDKKSEDALEAILGIIAYFTLQPIKILIFAWVTVKLWGWFITGVFGLPPITMATAVGLEVIISYFRYDTPKKSTDGETLLYLVLRSFGYFMVATGLCLLLGFFAHALSR